MGTFLAVGTAARRRRHVALAVGTLAVVGAALVGATGASAGPAFSQTMVVPYDGVNPCTGEPITGTGTSHFLLSENLSASGNLESDLDVRVDGLKAVGVLSGKKYVVQEAFVHRFVFGGASEDTFDIVAHYVRVGEDGTLILGDDFYEYLRTHITANSNGVVTASRYDVNPMPCQ